MSRDQLHQNCSQVDIAAGLDPRDLKAGDVVACLSFSTDAAPRPGNAEHGG